MRIKWKGEDLGEFDRMSLKEARYVKHAIGMLPSDFDRHLEKSDPDCIAVLVAIMYRRQDKDCDWEELDGDINDLFVVYTEAEKAQMTKEQRAQLAALERQLGESPEERGKDSSAKSGTKRTGTGAKKGASVTSIKRSPATARPSGSTSD